eukprot:2812628-Rhodomonas_salina.1
MREGGREGGKEREGKGREEEQEATHRHRHTHTDTHRHTQTHTRPKRTDRQTTYPLPASLLPTPVPLLPSPFSPLSPSSPSRPLPLSPPLSAGDEGAGARTLSHHNPGTSGTVESGGLANLVFKSVKGAHESVVQIRNGAVVGNGCRCCGCCRVCRQSTSAAATTTAT